MEKDNRIETITEDYKGECNRCHQLPTEFICNECHKGFYCSNCDKYMHSLTSKKKHMRKMITEENDAYSSQESFGTPDEVIISKRNQITSNQHSESSFESKDNSKRQRTVSQSCLDEIKQIYQQEKEELLATISLLNKKLQETTSTLNERINFLHTFIESMKQKHIDELVINESNWNKKLDEIILNEDNQDFLYDKIIRFEKIIKAQSSKINDYEEKLHANCCEYQSELSKVKSQAEEAAKEIHKLKAFFEQRLAEVTQAADEDKAKLMMNYERSIEALKEGYQTSKDKHVALLLQRDNEIKELIISNEKDRCELRSEIGILKESNVISCKEKEDVIKTCEMLKKALDDANGAIEKQKREIKAHIKEKTQLANEINLLKLDYEELEEKAEKVNHLMFGRFKQKKSQNEA